MLEQFYFSEQFQDAVLANLLRNASKFSTLVHLLKPQYFWGTHATKLCAIVLDYHAEHGHLPSFQILEDYVRQHYGREAEDLAAECITYVKKIASINTRDWKYVKERFVFFCRERALTQAIAESSAQIQSGKWPDGGFAPLFDKAMRIGQDIEEIGFRLYEDFDLVINKLTAEQSGVLTGYPLLDTVWHNKGWGPGWLVTILAPPKGFKSTWAINLAVNMTSKTLGREAVNVHYYACEISAELALARAYCRIGKQSMEVLYKQTELFRNAGRHGLEKHWKNGGKMLAKTFPSKGATIADIRAHALSAIEAYGWTPRVIFIDHAETIRAPKMGKDASDWRSQAEIYTQARALAYELECTVVMPDRCNKDTVNRDVPNVTSFQGSFEKAGIVDVAIGLCQTEIEYTHGEMRYFVFVNRHGPQYAYFRGKVNQPHMHMSLDSEIDFELERTKYEAEEAEHRTRGRSGRAKNDRRGKEHKLLVEGNDDEK